MTVRVVNVGQIADNDIDDDSTPGSKIRFIIQGRRRSQSRSHNSNRAVVGSGSADIIDLLSLQEVVQVRIEGSIGGCVGTFTTKLRAA